ncbi:MAG: ComEC/Rec2 family competence protein, partial [Candidatus Gallimonas sp.]
YIRNYCTDGVLEYVVATHADQDHIAAFVGTASAPGIFDSFDCRTIIDFPLTNKGDGALVREYFEKRDEEVSAGAVHYTALQCWNGTDGASRTYALAENVTMNVLYNYYYENESSDENNYSVCFLLSQGNNHYLFTGDLEESGESKLVEYNSLPKCRLFKGGHHGSKTSSTDALLSVIQPEIVCVCCCAGSPEYTTNSDNTFPTQAFIDRVAKYTDRIYVTTMATDVVTGGNKSWNFAPMNGTIVVQSSGDAPTVTGSNNSTILKETDWFAANRIWPSDA